MVTTPLKRIRLEQLVATEVLAQAVGVRAATINRIENARMSASLDLANRIALYFKNAVTRDQILYPQDYTAPKQPARAARQEKAVA